MSNGYDALKKARNAFYEDGDDASMCVARLLNTIRNTMLYGTSQAGSARGQLEEFITSVDNRDSTNV